MKHLFVILALIMSMFSTTALGDEKYRASVNNGTDSITVASDMVSDSICTDSADTPQPLSSSIDYDNSNCQTRWDDAINENIVALVAVIMSLGLPIFIVGLILWFKYKNKQAKYKLAAQALAAGQEIPSNLFNESETKSKDNEVFNKGVRNAFLGIGIGVFLWLLTETEGLAAIGFLIFCMGAAQMVIGYSARKREQSDEMRNNRFTQDNNRGKAAWNNPDIKNTPVVNENAASDKNSTSASEIVEKEGE